MPSEFAYRASLSLFGVRVEVESNSENAVSIARECISRGKRTEFSSDGEPSIYVVLRLYDVNLRRQPCVDRVDATSLCLNFERVAVRADPVSGHGMCEFPHDGEFGEPFAEAVNTVVMYLVAHAGRIPVHASAIMLQDVAVVLAGPSGSGKSSLALAAAQAGMDVLSEDTVFVQLRPGLRLWSRTDAIHVLESDAPVGTLGAMRFRSGRWKRILPLAAQPNFADRAVLCVLAPGDGLSLTPMTATDAIVALTAKPEPGYEFYGARANEAVRMLAGNGAWRLTLSKSPRAAIELIRRTIVPDKLG